MNDTKDRILDAAEGLLAEQGLTATSLRGITSLAKVNLGAVNYHFQTKEALIHAVFARRLGPLNRARLAALDACGAKAAGRPVPLEDLLRAFLGPVLRLGRDGECFIKLLGRMYTEPSLDIHRIFSAELGETVGRFEKAFRRTLPGLDLQELYWRLFFIIGSMAQIMAAGTLLKFISNGVCDPSDMEEAEIRLIRFAEAGLSAPATVRRKRSRVRKQADVKAIQL